jgi:hypothetical protein
LGLRIFGLVMIESLIVSLTGGAIGIGQCVEKHLKALLTPSHRPRSEALFAGANACGIISNHEA